MVGVFEGALLGCIGVNTLINVIQASGFWTRLKRWWRLRNKRLVTISKTDNPNTFFHVTKALHKVSANLNSRTTVSYGDAKVTQIYFIPDRNTTIQLITKYGPIWIKTISLDDYHVNAYEITCDSVKSDVIDKFLMDIIDELSPPVPLEARTALRTMLGIPAAAELSGTDCDSD